MKTQQRTRQIQALELLNELTEDLITGTRCYAFFESANFERLITNPSMKNPMLNLLRRMTLSHIILALSKFKEWYDKFKDAIPTDCRKSCKAIRQEIVKRKIVRFRNSRIGHIWDNFLDRPLTSGEIDKLINEIVGGNEEGFLLWINNPKSNNYPTTVIGVIERTRNELGIGIR